MDTGRDGGIGWRMRTLSQGALAGLFYIQKYRFLTIGQFALCANFSIDHASRVLRELERWKAVGYFGYTSIPGQGKTPKVYYLKRRGWEILHAESNIFEELIGGFTNVQKETTWSPHMYHRLKTIDLMIALECALHKRPHLRMVKAFLEYRMIKKGTYVTRETTDFVAMPEIPDNKIVPDAAFILENIETKDRALFFLEMDMGTERIVSRVPRGNRITLHNKMVQYDKYLKSFRYTQTYAVYGEFAYFILLFVTLTDSRLENIRREMQSLPAELADYYRLTTYDRAMTDFLGSIWKSRLFSDAQRYALVREE